MLVSSTIYYSLEYFFITFLCFDTLSFIVTYHNAKLEFSDNQVKDYKRLIFSWVYVFTLFFTSFKMTFVPLIDEIVLILLIFITFPSLHFSEAATDYMFTEDGLRKVFKRFFDFFISKRLAPGIVRLEETKENDVLN